MANQFRLPELGENIDEGEVIKVLVSVGDTVEKEQPIVEMETGKATLEIPSTVAGKVTEINVQEGDTVKVGAPILSVDGAAEEEPPPQKEANAEQAPAKETEVEPGPQPKEDVEPVPAEPQAPAEKVPEQAAPASPAPPEPPAPAARAEEEGEIPVPAAPSVRKFAREIGIDINQVTGSGEKGRVTIDDVKAFAKQLNEGRAAPGAGLSAPPLPDFSQWGPVERERLSGIRKLTAEQMSRSWANIPHVTQHDVADITDLEALRKRYAKKAEQAGGKLTPTAILLKVTASALKVFPQFNASVDTAKNEVVYKKYIHVGVAVDTPKGLLVPVIRDADKKNIIELSVELSEMAEKARTGKVSPAEMQGGTFTLTNLGGIGGTHFTPIINYPEAAILGIGRGRQEPILSNGSFEARTMLPLSLSYDHRLIDGADGARFLRWIAEAVNQPLLLALEG